ncbi:MULTISPECIES: polysaccharide deacetylase family protein [unclassified Anaerostipes]|uniref:polysaccharide deacetylase family protein n=1 Tax=unclassified Anaerostipes TaxID=2635253 RepID=UPI000A5DA056|nr:MULTISPECIES: polysaccharide deacetylase family protein [unclassified Anaerostipes]MCI5623335.1 polysaccharide deacetylase family protein [Anaerostipes sp.]
MKPYHKILSKITVIIIFCLSVFGVFKNMQEFLQKNIYVWDEREERKIPIYCVDTKEKVLSLTFDVAWGNEDMNDILQILKNEKVKATFFFSGDWINRYPKDVKKVFKEGHDIGNHGDNHKYMTKLSKEEQQKEIQGAHDKVKGLLGISMDLFRPPYGDYNSEVIKNAEEMGYYSIQWSVDSLDWMEPGVDEVINKVCNHKALENGAIILMHTGTKCTKEALQPMIQDLKKKGYKFVPVSQLIYRKGYRIDPTGKQKKY